MLRRVVVTGAAGSIGRVVVTGLQDRWDLVATDIRDCGTRLDVTDLAACASAFTGADAVVHLAANPDPDAGFEDLLRPNVVGAWTVASASAAANVPRLVLASSLQVVSAHPTGQQVRADDPPRPANVYGATKAWGEALGAWLAATSATSVVALRLGHVAAVTPTDEADAAAWLSHRDAVELVRVAVEGDVHGLLVVNGTSDNRFAFADLTAARALGYVPVDDAWHG